MFRKVFYIVAIIVQLAVIYETEEYELEVPYEHLASKENPEIVAAAKSNLDERDHDNVIVSDNPEKNSTENVQEEQDEVGDKINFVGPVNAKGSVSVAANFGYNAPGPFSYPEYPPNFGYPLFYPQYLYSPALAYPMLYTFPYIPTTSLFLPGLRCLPHLDKSQSKNPGMKFDDNLTKARCKVDAKQNNNSHDNMEKSQNKLNKTDNKDFYIEVRPTINVISTLPDDKDDLVNSIEVHSPEEILANTVANTGDVDFTDYDENDSSVDNLIEINDNKDKKKTTNDAKDENNNLSEDRRVFGGFLPAKGNVKIAARF